MREIIEEKIDEGFEEEIKLGSCPLAEQETHIHFMRTDDYASIYATDKTTITKLDRLCKESPEYYQLINVGKLSNGTVVSKTYRLSDKTLVSFRSKKMTREMTDEQREAASIRMKELAERRRRLQNTQS